MDLGALHAELFEPRVGSGFRFADADAVVIEATLLECTVHPRATMPGATRAAFSLIFAVPLVDRPEVRGGTFIVHHAAMESFGPVHVERIHSARPGTALFEIAFN